MRDPRFQIRTLTGFGIGPAGGRGNRKPASTYYVMDTAYAWEIVGSYHNEEQARAAAEDFNRRYPVKR